MSRFAVDCLLVIVFLGLAGAALAQTSVMLNVGSEHLEDGDYCETNQGLGLAYGSSFKALGGFYKNSMCRTSWYAGTTYQPLAWGKFRAGAVAMVVNGYESPLSLAAGAVFAYEGLLSVIWIPNKRGQFNRGVLGLQMELARW